MNPFRFVPVALCAGFLAGHGFEVTPDLLPVAALGGFVYLSAVLLGIGEGEDEGINPTLRR